MLNLVLVFMSAFLDWIERKAELVAHELRSDESTINDSVIGFSQQQARRHKHRMLS